MRILFLNPNQIKRYNWGHQLFKNEFAKHHDVVYYGKGFTGFNPKLAVPQIIKDLSKRKKKHKGHKSHKSFDIILTYDMKYSESFKGLGVITDIPKVHIQVDYKTKSDMSFIRKPGFSSYRNLDKCFRREKFDLIFAFVTPIVESIKTNLKMKRVYFLPFCVDINVYKNLGLEKDIDVMAVFSFSTSFPNRRGVQRLVEKLEIKSSTNRVTRHKYVETINRSKIFVHSNSIYRYLNMKYSEVLACGTLFLTDKPKDFEEEGFVDGKHLVLYDNLEDLEDKIKYYLEHDEEREQIARQGMEFVRENHSCAVRVKQFTEIVQSEFRMGGRRKKHHKRV